MQNPRAHTDKVGRDRVRRMDTLPMPDVVCLFADMLVNMRMPGNSMQIPQAKEAV